MMNLARKIILLFLGILIISCNNLSGPESTMNANFEEMYSNCQMNTDIEFALKQKTYYLSEDIWLNISNRSNNLISFPEGYNVQIWTYDHNLEQWIEIINDATYITNPGSQVYIDPMKDNIPGFRSFGIVPIIHKNGPITARVVVFGSPIKDGVLTDECVGAYTDITLLQ